jgi:hypothetical protein
MSDPEKPKWPWNTNETLDGAGTRAADKALEETSRTRYPVSDLRKDLEEVHDQSEDMPAKPLSEPPSSIVQPMHLKDRWLFILLAWSAIPTAAVVAGIVAFSQSYPHWGAGLTLFGLLGMTAVTLHLLETKPRPLPKPGPIVAAVAVATWFFLGWMALVQLRSSNTVKPPTTDEIAAAVVKAIPKNAGPSPMFAEAGMNRPPDPRNELIGGPYLATDIQRLIPIFFEINDALTRAAPVFREEQQIVGSWQAQLQNIGSKAFVEQLQALAGKMVSLRATVDQIVEKNNADRNELSSAIISGRDSVDQNANEIGNLIANVQALAAIPIETQVLVLSRDVRRLDNAATAYNAWIQGSISDVQSKIRRLRDYKQ